MSEEKLVFASEAWVDEARRILEELVAAHGEASAAFSVCEVFSDTPPEADPSGTAAWHFYIDGETVRVGQGEVDDTDVKIRADYTATLPTARLVYTPEILAQRAKAREQGPNPNVEGDMGKAPPWLVELHNQLAVITA